MKEVIILPKQTFFNLKDNKKEKIEQALIKEFGQASFEKASISNIIREADIPRGSFYQYFENKEDAISYIIGKFIKEEKEKIYSRLLKNNGDIFQTSIDLYDHLIEVMSKTKNLNLFKNILQELRKNNINAFEDNTEIIYTKKTITSMINKSELNLDNDEELIYFLKILNVITRNIAIEVLSGLQNADNGKEILVKELEILKKGMKKNNK